LHAHDEDHRSVTPLAEHKPTPTSGPVSKKDRDSVLALATAKAAAEKNPRAAIAGQLSTRNSHGLAHGRE